MPLAIVYAASEQDVLAVVNYAQSADIAVAVRSGGHHYIGASSTNVTERAVTKTHTNCADRGLIL